MTIKEAIDDIKTNIKPVVGGKSLDMAIEALEERKTGRWELVYCNHRRTTARMTCSCCGFESEKQRRYPYCPNCGADMMEVKHER